MDESVTLAQITPDPDDAIRRRIKFASTARALLWCYHQFTKEKPESFVYTSELAKFLGVSTTRSYQILHEFELFGLLWAKRTTSTFNEFHACKHDTTGELVMQKYVILAKKTLGLI